MGFTTIVHLWTLGALAVIYSCASAEIAYSVEGWPMATRMPSSGETLPPTVLSAVPARDGCWCGPAQPGGAWAGGWSPTEDPSLATDWEEPADSADDAGGGVVGIGWAAAVCRGAGLCRRVPTAALAALAKAGSPPERLTITRTAVRVLLPGDFLPVAPKLRALRVDDNPQLDTVAEGVFDGMQDLRFLSLSFNPRLRRLEPGALQGLPRLQELRMEGCGVRAAEDVAGAMGHETLPRLQRLSLSSNPLQRLGEFSFSALEGGGVRELRVALCRLSDVHPAALRPLRRLRALHAGRNAALNGSTVAALLHTMAADAVPLRTLALNQMGFRGALPYDVLSAAGALNVTSLVLAGNQFPVVSAESVPEMPRLRHLDLSECVVVAVEADALGPGRLPALRSLVLAGNHLTGVSPGVLPPQITSLDLSLNLLDRSRRSVTFDLGEGNFSHMTNLTYLNVSFNNINTVTPRTFTGLINLRDMLSLQNSSIVEIQPGSFKELTNLTFLNLERNPFPEFSGLTASIFERLDNLEVLMLAECGITNFSDPDVFSHLGSLQYLMLEHNHISSLKPQIFSHLINLRGLDLSHNKIEAWPEEEIFIGSPNLSIVFLADNKITYLSPAMLQDFSKLDHLDIFDNPFSCECEPFLRGKEWLSKNNLTLDKIFSPGRPPLCYSPDIWKNKHIIDFIQLSEYDGECPTWAPPGEGTRAYIIVGVILGMLMILGAVCGAMAYKYRSYIRYWTFLVRRDLRRRGLMLGRERRKRFCKGYVNYQYDAFVSYSSEDRNFVVRLVAMLENYEPHLKLCVYERDFQIGTVISEAVLESVACSRHTLLIVSDAFARSQWCMWELRLAEHYSLFFEDDECGGVGRKQDPLVMVKLGNVAAAHMTPTLKHLLRTRVYLDWDPEPRKQRQFWEKLRTALAPPQPPSIKTSTQ